MSSVKRVAFLLYCEIHGANKRSKRRHYRPRKAQHACIATNVDIANKVRDTADRPSDVQSRKHLHIVQRQSQRQPTRGSPQEDILFQCVDKCSVGSVYIGRHETRRVHVGWIVYRGGRMQNARKARQHDVEGHDKCRQ